MAKDRSKGRGTYTDRIELKYAQLPHKIYELLFIKYANRSEIVRALALLHFIYHFFTNEGYESLQTKDADAYMLCDIMNEATYNVQNSARWTCYEEFYDGRNDIDYEIAEENYQKKLKDKKKESNRVQYLKRKQEEYNPEKEREEGKRLFDEACKKHGLKD